MRWLKTLHEQWMSARKRRVTSAARPFRRDWEALLSDAGITSAENQQAAQREAEKLKQIRLIPFKSKPRYIDKIEIPLASEAWLHAQFGSQTGAEAQQRALAVLERWAREPHPLLPENWSELCSRLKTEFAIPRVVEPFRWLEADRVDELLRLLFQLTSREWTDGTLVRDASMQLGHGSKHLESQQSFIERASAQLFGRETPLEALGIQTSNSVLHYCGPLALHMTDHVKTLDLRFQSTLSVSELEKAVCITTTAKRLLTVENHKTTFLQLALADEARTTLVVASSFPTPAVRMLMHKLPPELPHHHFGDTDPSGWDILSKLREVSGREVKPFQMSWRPDDTSKPLTRRDHQIIGRLMHYPLMTDCQPHLLAMLRAGRCGDFEQESLGQPLLKAWPFFPTASPSS